MPHLNPFAISGALIVLTYLPLVFFIFLKGKTKLSRIFTLHLLSILFWGIASFSLGVSANPEIALNIARFGCSAVYFIPAFLLHTVLILTRKPVRFLLFLTYAQAIIFSIANGQGKIFPSAKLIFNSFYYPQSNNLHFLSVLIWIVIVVVAHFKLIIYYKKTYPEEKQSLFYLIAGASIGFIGGTMNFLPTFNLNIYPFGNFAIPIYSAIVTYAILRHQLLEIVVIIRKSIAYSVFLALVSLIYLLIVVLFERLLQGIIGYRSIFISALTAFLLGIIFVPLKNKIQYLIDQCFFKGSQIQIAEQNELLRQELARSERLKAVATLASGMAHEIKNPLTALKTFSEYLPEKKNDPEFLEKFSKIVGGEVDRIDSLVHQLLEFAKPSPPSLSDTNIHLLIEDTLNLLSNQLLKHKINLVKEFSAEKNLTLKIDPNQIRQALLNILLNAIEAMEAGGTLRVETRATSHESLDIVIKDTGPGISPKDLPHIFDPFFSKKDHGTGLGLAITHQIITEHKGKVSVISEIGKGTGVEIELPCGVS